MRYMPIILTLVACLFAQPAFSMPSQFGRPSGTYCDSRSPGNCYTINESDYYEPRYEEAAPGNRWGFFHTGANLYTLTQNNCWYVYSSLSVWREYGSPSSSRICVYTGGQYVSHTYRQYLFPDIPDEDKDLFTPARKMTISEMWSNFNRIKQTITIDINSSRPDAYCAFYNATNENMQQIPFVALDRAPDSVMNACGFTKRLQQYLNEQPPQPPTDNTDNNSDGNQDDILIPQNAARCGAISNGSDRVTVRSARHSCNQAKTVLRAYSRSLRSPRGWSCTASMSDARFKARCSKKTRGRARAAAAVYGIWIRR